MLPQGFPIRRQDIPTSTHQHLRRKRCFEDSVDGLDLWKRDLLLDNLVHHILCALGSGNVVRYGGKAGRHVRNLVLKASKQKRKQ
jgi:hypothetical protein